VEFSFIINLINTAEAYELLNDFWPRIYLKLIGSAQDIVRIKNLSSEVIL